MDLMLMQKKSSMTIYQGRFNHKDENYLCMIILILDKITDAVVCTTNEDTGTFVPVTNETQKEEVLKHIKQYMVEEGYIDD